MITKITITILSLLIFISTSVAYACDFKIGQFGDPKEKIVIEPVPLSFPDQFGGESLAIPIQDLCKNDNSLYGTIISFSPFPHENMV